MSAKLTGAAASRPPPKACTKLGAHYRHARPRTPQANGLEAALLLLPPGDRFAMAARLNGRISGEALGIDIHWHRALEPPLRGFNMAHNSRCQRVLGGRTPNKTIAEHPEA